MKIILRMARPRDDKERMFKLETAVNDLKNPGEAHLTIDQKEYLLEVHFDG